MSYNRQVGKCGIGRILNKKFVLVDRVCPSKEIIVDIAKDYKIDKSYSKA